MFAITCSNYMVLSELLSVYIIIIINGNFVLLIIFLIFLL